MNIICITPISHINNVHGNLNSIFTKVFLYPEISYEHLRNILSTISIQAIFVNPNKLNYKLDANLLRNTNVKYILTASTGTNHIDKEYCKNNNIEIFSLTKELDIIEKISSTAEHAFSLMLSLIRNIPSSFNSVKNGDWNYEPFIGRQLNYLTIGIIGYGRLGSKFYNYCKAFGSNVLVNDLYKEDVPNNADLDILLNKSDVISLHIHLDGNYNFFNKNLLSKLNKKIYLINTSRGEVVDEEDVIYGLESGIIKGYATDVLKDELGNIKNSKLIEYSKTNNNVIITPHIGGMTLEAQELAYNGVINVFKRRIN